MPRPTPSSLGADLTQLWVSAKRRAYLDAFALCGFFMAFVFAGVSTMLWAIHPLGSGGSLWLLLFVPVFPAVLAIACMMSRQPYDLRDLERTRSQFHADLAMLREIPSR